MIITTPGITDDGVELLERYVDVTSDVQTAALVMLHGSPLPESLRPDAPRPNTRIDTWVTSYRELLDTWRLWHQR